MCFIWVSHEFRTMSIFILAIILLMTGCQASSFKTISLPEPKYPEWVVSRSVNNVSVGVGCVRYSFDDDFLKVKDISLIKAKADYMKTNSDHVNVDMSVSVDESNERFISSLKHNVYMSSSGTVPPVTVIVDFNVSDRRRFSGALYCVGVSG